MALVTRTPYADGNIITAAGQNANEEAIVTQVNGNIENVNISPTAGIEGTKLADAPNGIPTVKINDLAVNENKLATDSVTTTKIKDSNVTSAKLAADSITTAKIQNGAVTGAKIGATEVNAAKIKFSTYAWTTNVALAAGRYISKNTGLSVAGYMPIFVDVKNLGGTSTTSAVEPTFAVAPPIVEIINVSGTWYLRLRNPAGNADVPNSTLITLYYISA